MGSYFETTSLLAHASVRDMYTERARSGKPDLIKMMCIYFAAPLSKDSSLINSPGFFFSMILFVSILGVHKNPF